MGALAAWSYMPGMSPPRDASTIPTRPLGRTGNSVTLFALGGEGVLRRHGRAAEDAVGHRTGAGLRRELLDTALAYAATMDYYGPSWVSAARRSSWPRRRRTAREMARSGSWTTASGGCGLTVWTCGSFTISARWTSWTPSFRRMEQSTP